MSKNKKRILVAGSLAYDHLMNYDGLFQNVLLPEKIESLSVTFTTSNKTVDYGGCGGNIAYTLKLLGEDPLLLGIGGKDFEEYKKWLGKNKISTAGVVINLNAFTASAHILTDKNQHQLTIFQMGAMETLPELPSLENLLGNTKSNDQTNISWAIIAPDHPERMLRVAQECVDHEIPFIFDPAQQIGAMTPAQLLEGLKKAQILITNEYETALLAKKLGMSKEKLITLVPNSIETHGSKGCSGISWSDRGSKGHSNSSNRGSTEKTSAGTFRVKAVPPKKLVDPTGCGDAFRAGILAGLNENLTIEQACKIGTLAATYNLEQKGTQQHRFTLTEFRKRLAENFPG